MTIPYGIQTKMPENIYILQSIIGVDLTVGWAGSAKPNFSLWRDGNRIAIHTYVETRTGQK